MAKVLQIRDENGMGIDYAQFEEVIHPVYIDIPRKLKSIKEFKYEKDDVFICTYPKSGTHWVAALVHLLRHTGSQEEVKTKTIPLIPFIDMLSTRTVAALPRPRIIVSHLRYHRLPVEHVQKGGKIILLLRNPKDAAVSMFYHSKDQNELKNQQSWGHFLKCFMNGQVLTGSFFDYVNSWSKVIEENIHSNIIVVYYEDLVRDCLRELKRIQDFLGTGRDEVTLNLIAQCCSYGNLQKSIASGKMISTIRDTAGESILLRKGKVGDWRNHFSTEQNKIFEEVCLEKLKHTVFNFQYENDIPSHKL